MIPTRLVAKKGGRQIKEGDLVMMRFVAGLATKGVSFLVLLDAMLLSAHPIIGIAEGGGTEEVMEWQVVGNALGMCEGECPRPPSSPRQKGARSQQSPHRGDRQGEGQKEGFVSNLQVCLRPGAPSSPRRA